MIGVTNKSLSLGVGVRRVVLVRGELDKLEGPQYAARRANEEADAQGWATVDG